MRYRRRLRSRIILSFLLLGFGLTSLFAGATLVLRSRIESQLIEATLQREVDNLVAQVRANPDQRPNFTVFEAATWSPRTLYKAPLSWQHLETGVHDIAEPDANGDERNYKLAVRRDADLISFVRFDYSGAALGAQQLVVALAVAVPLFTLFAGLVGIWSSRRVMSPVADLASRLRAYSGQDRPERLAPHFANDEVGQLAAALDDYADRLTELVQRDREFNADVSHELRTPLAVIRGAAELLLASPDLSEKMRLRLQRIDRAEGQCTHLISALLMLSRNERGTGATDLCKLAEQLADANRVQIGSKPLLVRVECVEDGVINAPESVVSVALGNLLGNACKYTAEGEVVIRIQARQVSVEDTGPGLSAEDAERMFERGYRGSYAGGTKGGGMGLSIVRRLCDLYGWDVRMAPRSDRAGAIATLRFGD